MREVIEQILDFCDVILTIVVHVHMDVSSAFCIDAFHTARIGSRSLCQVAFTDVDRQPSLVFIIFA